MKASHLSSPLLNVGCMAGSKGLARNSRSRRSYQKQFFLGKLMRRERALRSALSECTIQPLLELVL